MAHKRFDIIGDIHGHAAQLCQLLTLLGYQKTRRGYHHPDRTALFVGDFIDRGPEQVAVLEIIRTMIENGAAKSVMGNHEFNAIGWLTSDGKGGYLRAHNHKNRHQHHQFLEQVGENSHQHKEWIEWFKQLPLWLDLPELQLIHACWDPSAMSELRPYLNERNQIVQEQISCLYESGHPAYRAAELLLKGVEFELPEGHMFTDKDGHDRTVTRIKWWNGSGALRESAIVPEEIRQQLPDLSLSRDVIQLADVHKPTFIGHYWLQGKPAPQSKKVVCVDYSVAKHGQLVAYRFDGEAFLHQDRFIGVMADRSDDSK